VPPRGSEIFVQRQYYKLVARPTLLKGAVYDSVRCSTAAASTSGERVEVVLTIEAKNDLEYLLFEDLKPAGFEAVQVKSGEWLYAREIKSARWPGASRRAPPPSCPTRRLSALHRPPARRAPGAARPERRAVPRQAGAGRVGDPLTLRAEAPGRFHALPVLGRPCTSPRCAATAASCV
jgi:hypothetical protein